MSKINNNFDVYNFLNIINRRIGKLYRLTGYNPLPDNFEIDEHKIEDVLILGQMKDETIMPYFINENKKEIKKHFKHSLKNCMHIIKHHQFEKYVSKDFSDKLTDYFNIRKDLTDLILKDIKKVEADETALYQEIYNLNPILGSLLDEMFEPKIDFDSLFQKLESDYNSIYTNKIKLLEKLKKKKIEQQGVQKSLITKSASKTKNTQKERKNIEKTVKNQQNLQKTQEIQQIRAEHARLKKEKNNKEK